MKVESLRDVLKWTVTFHQNLKECLKECATKNEDERARLILIYLSEHEGSLERIISGFETVTNKNVLDTWCYDYLKEHKIIPHGHCDFPFSNLTMDEVVKEVTAEHKKVIALYEHLHSRVDTNSAQEFLATIQAVEEHEIRRMVQAANRFSDL
ncbi:ATPase [Pseudidiomarina salinarum]|uniref:ATPase n=1 Tax=Pseudidiomarina salinarum TaxID=435908 RepID=A0A094ITW5_9GAMM|nr:hypothetical protein [Pseudidiomarina salinarum]KFZ30577.1 ATPase [Pseudidiomarina salinarum]RUO69088.1 ATPase [Pseudidiomarina salinarum]